MNIQEFRERAHQLVDWMADYFARVDTFPVKSQVKPGEIMKQLPPSPPLQAEGFDQIFKDFEETILPGITHWQHPSFFAYFPANNSYPSILGEMLTATLGAQCMSWETSPAATELEEVVMKWVGQMIGIPDDFSGVIQDTASTATLCSLLTAREKISNNEVNYRGFFNLKPLRIYCSQEAHSSIEKAVKIAGFGKENLCHIEVDEQFAMIPEKLEQAIKEDIKNQLQPLAVVAAIGTTSSTAIDPLKKISEICRKFNVWLHVDAAYAGTALILDEKRWMIEGIEEVDTFVFNPHKWMFTNFDCSAYFVKDKIALLNTFAILPEYLKTDEAGVVNNYRDWGIQLGRRFRALKLWFVIRSFGLDGLKERIASHICWAEDLTEKIKTHPDFEILAPVPLATVCFRYRPVSICEEEEIDKLNKKLLENINQSGAMFLTHTKLNGKYSIRFVVGQTYVNERHIQKAWERIKAEASNLIPS